MKLSADPVSLSDVIKVNNKFYLHQEGMDTDEVVDILCETLVDAWHSLGQTAVEEIVASILPEHEVNVVQKEKYHHLLIKGHKFEIDLEFLPDEMINEAEDNWDNETNNSSERNN